MAHKKEKKEKKAKEKKEKKEKKAATSSSSKRDKDPCADEESSDDETQAGTERTSSGGAADDDQTAADGEDTAAAAAADVAAADGGDSDEDGDADADVDASSVGSSGQCKHAAKCIRAASVRAHLKSLAQLIQQRKRPATAGDSSAPAALWLCMCGLLDVPVTHFSPKHAVGLDLMTQTWRCFPCQLQLHEGTVAPRALPKLRLVAQQIETTLSAATGAANKPTATGASSSDSREANGRPTSSGSAAASSSPSAAVAASSGVVVKGLRNLGNTCFFNSVAQCLAASTPLYGALLYPTSRFYDAEAVSHGKQAPLQTALLQFLEAMQAPGRIAPPPPPPPPPPSSAGKKHRSQSAAPRDDSRVVVPSSLLSAVQTCNPMFKGGRQHDSHELLRTLLNGICVEKEDEVRRQRQAATADIVRGWSAERVRQWAASFGLGQQAVLDHNLVADAEHPWDGAFLLWLIDKWADKSAKKARLVLHAGITDVDDKRIIARQLQRIKDGFLPDSESNASGSSSSSSSDDSASCDVDSAALASVPLHPFSSLLSSNFIYALFGGVTRNTVQCLSCACVSTTHELFLDLSLAIEAPRNAGRAMQTVAAASSSAAGASDTPPKKPASASAGAIAKHKNSKHVSKQSKKHAKRLQRRGAGKKNSSTSAAVTEDEGSDEETDPSAATAPPQEEESSADGRRPDADADAAKGAVDPAGSVVVASPASDAQVAAGDSTEVASAAAPATQASASESAPAPGSDAFQTLSDHVAALSIHGADTDSASEMTPPQPDGDAAAADSVPASEPALVCAASSDAVDAAASASGAAPPVDSASPSTASAAVSNASVDAPIAEDSNSRVAALLSYLRAHRLGFDRLHASRADRPLTLLDCLGAYTDPDLLTGSNRYGCSQCARRAQEAKEEDGSATAAAAPASATPILRDAAASVVAEIAAASSTSPADATPVAEPTEVASSSAADADADADVADSQPASTTLPSDQPSAGVDADAAAPVPESQENGDAAPAAPAPADVPADASASVEAAAVPAPDDVAVDSSSPPTPSPAPPASLPLCKRDAVKRSQILVPPTVLTVHFKRFHQSGRSIEKSSKAVDIPLCFNIAAFMTAPTATADSALAQPFEFPLESRAPVRAAAPVADCWYHLYAIVSHGGGMGGGHYVAYMRKQNLASACARDGDGDGDGDRPVHSSSSCRLDSSDLSSGWHYASDSDCRAISVAEVMRAQVYLAFYCKA